MRMEPVVILIIGVVAVLGMIMVLRVNAFIALITAAMLVSLLSPGALAEKITRVAEAFGSTVGSIGIVIALAAVIGKCLMESGAADRIVRSFLSVFGEKRISWALMGSGFVLSVPVFFDTVFYLLVPLARSLYTRTQKNYMLYLMAICAGAAITHTLVPPTPGPLYVADQFNIDLGLMIFVGILVALPTAIVALFVCKLLSRFVSVPMRPYSDEPEPDPLQDEELPPLWLSLLPVLLPVFLISTHTIANVFARAELTQLLRQSIMSAEIADDEAVAQKLAQDLVKKEELYSDSVEVLARGLVMGRIREDIEKATPLAQQLLNKRILTGTENPQLRSQSIMSAQIADDEADAQKLAQALIKRDLYSDSVEAMAQGLVKARIREDIEAATSLAQQLLNEGVFARGEQSPRPAQTAADVTAVLGSPNLALLLSAVIAMALLVWKRQMPLKKLAQTVDKALMSGGVIILITAGGGAFGAMLRVAGIQTAVESAFGSGGENVGIMILLAAFGVASMLKFAQGSSTVSMITTSSMFAAMAITPEMLGCHLIYLAQAIGAGSLVGSWMNDSGFWIVARMGVLTAGEALKTWTVLLVALGFTAFGFTLLYSRLLPMV
ncbi:MAG: gluconate permease [Planctomycetes bacterium]|nr:gluconate permease [Planctomycetota bacterium]